MKNVHYVFSQPGSIILSSNRAIQSAKLHIFAYWKGRFITIARPTFASMNSIWSAISLSFLFIIAVLGTTMRAMSLTRVPLQYSHVMHAHSHTAFQGWIYMAMILLLTRLFLNGAQTEAGRYREQLKATALIVTGILISFTLQGYGLYSIVFSTLFQLLNYGFIYRFLGDVKGLPDTVSLRWVKAGLWLGVLSTLGPFAVGFFSAKGMGGSEAYHSALYFFLHFQYNGWFQFVAIGLFFRWLEKENVPFPAKKAQFFFRMFAFAIVPAYALSLLGMSFGSLMWVPAAVAALLHLIGLWGMWHIGRHEAIQAWFAGKSGWVRALIALSAVSFYLKYALLFLSIFPKFQQVFFTNRHLIVAYLHLCLLGVITSFFLAVMVQTGWLRLQAEIKIGVAFLFVGFAVTEALLIAAGAGRAYPYLLLMFSGMMAVGTFSLVMGSVFGRSKGGYRTP